MTMEEIFGEAISEYTAEQAVADGVVMLLGTTGKLRCSTNFAFEVAGCYELHHDGKLAHEHPPGRATRPARYRSENEAFGAALRLQGQSWDYATRYDGWSMRHEIDGERLQRAVSGVVGEYVGGNYCAPRRAADAPEEADAQLAYYLWDRESQSLAMQDAEPSDGEVRVWAQGPGDGSLVLMLPEDY